MTSILLPLLLGATVDLITATDCPSRDAVTVELARLAPAPLGSSSHDEHGSAEVRPMGDSLYIALRTPQGRLVAERTLPRSGSCPELAAASAVVIAAWEGDMRTDLGPELPPSQGAALPPRATPLAGSISEPAGFARSGRDDVRPWEVGGSVVASRESDLAPGLTIDAQIGRRSSAFAGRLAILATGAHALALGPNPGQSRWSRAALDLGVRDRAWLGAGALDAHLDVAIAVIRLVGAGFGTNYARAGFDFGAGAGVRWAWAIGRIAPFLALDAGVWPSRKFVTAEGTGAEVRLPLFELRGAVGLSFGRFR